MAPIPVLSPLPLGYVAMPVTPEERALGLKFHLVRPGVKLERVRRRRVPLDDADIDIPEVEEAERSAPVATPTPKKIAALDVHRTSLTPEIREKIIRLFTQAEPLPIRMIAKRFGLSYKSVWGVVAHLAKAKPKQRPRARRPRAKRSLGLGFVGSVVYSRPLLYSTP